MVFFFWCMVLFLLIILIREIRFGDLLLILDCAEYYVSEYVSEIRR